MATTDEVTRAHEAATALLPALERERQAIASQMSPAVETEDVGPFLSLKGRLWELPDRLARATRTAASS